MELTPLAPLQASAEFWDDIDETSIESELKQLFIALFEHFLRTKFRRIDHYGYPHLLDEDDFETVLTAMWEATINKENNKCKSLSKLSSKEKKEVSS